MGALFDPGNSYFPAPFSSLDGFNSIGGGTMDALESRWTANIEDCFDWM
jgi:hypothetical protein